MIDRAARDLGDPASAVVPVAGAGVELTSLGRYFVWSNLLAEGSDAPLLERRRDTDLSCEAGRFVVGGRPGLSMPLSFLGSSRVGTDRVEV